MRQVEKAEAEEQKARFTIEAGHTVIPESVRRERAWWAAEVERLGARLRELLT